MKFYSTNNSDLKVDLKQAVTQGLAPDNGLYMPEEIKPLPANILRSASGSFVSGIILSGCQSPGGR